MKALIASVLVALLIPAGAPVCASEGCCKVCKKGKACGDSCIAIDRRCTKGAGCACDG